MNLPNGHLLQNGKYRLAHVIGQGGFGITYKGVWFTEVKGPLGTVKTEVPVCIKEYFFKDYCYRDVDSYAVKVHSETGRTLFNKFKEKLIKEAKILSEVHHPYIVNVLEVFEENDTAYIAMEYISGSSLKYALESNGVLRESVLLKYVHQIGEALQFVHEKNILHLDIKPSNILIDKNDNARLIDFGVSKRYDIEQQETSTTMLTLSKGFASIEQYDDEGTLNFSPCPDIYSLGATMYNLLTGKIPTESILRAARPLQNPTELNPDITSKTEVAILKSMQIIPADRFHTISEMMDALEFPPAEKEEKIEEPVEKDSSTIHEEDDDTTVIYNPKFTSSPKRDDEQTVVSFPENDISLLQDKKKKKKNGLVVTALITIFVVLGSVVAFFIYGVKPEGEIATNTLQEKKDSIEVDSLDSAFIPDRIEESKEDLHSQPIQEEKKTDDKSVSTIREKASAAQTAPPSRLPSNEAEEVVPKVDKPTVAEIDTKYADLIAAGKSKIATADYESAQKIFAEAKKMKLTEEVVRLEIDCESKAKEKRIADRKALYEEKMDFGKYKIVRKTSTERYGAIDASANERIPCKYLSVGKAENGRAFEREDHLFDIYNSDGVLVTQGATYY